MNTRSLPDSTQNGVLPTLVIRKLRVGQLSEGKK